MLGKLRAMLNRSTKPRMGEVAAPNVGDLLEPYIGELPLHPAEHARDAYSHTDETEALKVYRQTLRDERCAATLDQRLNAAISTPWDVEPGGEGARDAEAAEHLAEQLRGIDFPRVCRQILHGVWYGWAVGEAIWARANDRVVLNDLPVKSPDRFWWEVDGTLLLRTWKQPQGEPVPDRKFVVLARPTEHSDLPYAPGLARWCYWPVWMKRHGMKFWSVALERFGSPTAKGTYPMGATEEEQRRLLSLIQSLATGAGVAIPEGQDIELLESARRAGGDYAEFCRYLDQSITATILGQSSTTDQGAWRGTAEVQRAVRDETIAADTHLLDSTLNTTIARWLTQWNFPGAATSSIQHDAAPPEDLDARAKREEVIARTTGWRPTMRHIIDVYGGEWEERHRAGPPGGEAPPGGEDPDDGGAGDGPELAGATDPPAFAAGDAPDAGGEDDVGDLLREQLRRAVGPLLDRWVDTVREQLDNADSLGGVRDRLDTMAPDINIEAAARALRDGLAVAELAGRVDADAPAKVEFAASDPSTLAHARLPFDEQIAFFRRKLSLPTQSWTDIWQSQHDVAFVVAGAARDDLVSDLRGAVDQAIAEGTTLATFRRDFDAIVAKHGWSYKGGRSWRTEVIYGTNLRTSYAAGRYRQMKDVAERRPYWHYRHSDASERPRHDHLAWDGLVLRHDDPWWTTHYPPNGWGCKCFVEALNARGIARLGKSGPDSAPALDARTVQVGQGPSRRTAIVPGGIDPGWAYAPGQTATLGPAARRYLETSARRAPGVAAAGVAATLARDAVLDALGDEWRRWRRWRRDAAGRGRQAEAFALGAMHPDVMDWLRREQAVEVANAAVTVTLGELAHATRADKATRGAAAIPADTHGRCVMGLGGAVLWRGLTQGAHDPRTVSCAVSMAATLSVP